MVSCLPGWWFGTFFIFPYIGNVIIPTDELHHFSDETTNKKQKKPVAMNGTKLS